jgi:hypothetical protein
MQMRYPILVLLSAAAACGGGPKPEAAPGPARGLRDLRADDSEVKAIALEASRLLPPGGSPQPAFGGVYVDGRRNRSVSDDVARSLGYASVSATRVAAPQCRATNSAGQSTPIPCPASVSNNMPPLYVFDEVIATSDSAYVGFSERTDKRDRSSCITLVRVGTSWRTLHQAVIADARRCGK